MSEKELRAALAKVVWDHMTDQPWREDADETADDLLPIVRAYAAAVLRAAAQEQRNEAKTVPDTDEGTHADGHRCATDFLDRRADALAPKPTRKEARA